MKIVVGLGNPGAQYHATKHNLGFRVVERLAEQGHFPAFTVQAKFQAEISRVGDVVLAKPQTFMNRSGEATAALLQMYKDQEPELYVIHDDLDLELGNWKIQKGTGPKVHNGLLSIYDQLGTKDFWHVRLGVDTRQGDRTIPPDRYVLMPFTSAEAPMVESVITEVSQDLSQRFK